MKTFCAHSYKGGTGKTLLSANIAAETARRGYKVALFDLDLRAPSLTALFNYEPEQYLNDFFKGITSLDEVLIDVSPAFDNIEGSLHVAFSSPEIQVIRKMIAKGGTFHINMLKSLLNCVRDLQGQGFDFLFLDSSPGIEPWSVNAIIVADATFIVLKPGRLDRVGTKRMLEGIYQQLPEEKTFYLVFNKTVGTSLTEALGNFPVFARIPCHCDVIANDEEIFVLTRPEHPFSANLIDIVNNLEASYKSEAKE